MKQIYNSKIHDVNVLESKGWKYRERQNREHQNKDYTINGRKYKLSCLLVRNSTTLEKFLRVIKGVGLTLVTFGIALTNRKVRRLFTKDTEKLKILNLTTNEYETLFLEASKSSNKDEIFNLLEGNIQVNIQLLQPKDIPEKLDLYVSKYISKENKTDKFMRDFFDGITRLIWAAQGAQAVDADNIKENDDRSTRELKERYCEDRATEINGLIELLQIT